MRQKKNNEEYLLNGKKTFVIDGASADILIVLARTSGNSGELAGLTLFIVDANADGLNIIKLDICLLYTSPSPRDRQKSRMPSSA